MKRISQKIIDFLKRGSLLLACLLLMGACGDDKPTASSLTVPGSLLGFVDASDPIARRTALYLLADLALNGGQLESVEASCEAMTESLDQLFCNYALARRLQSVENTNQFVQLFPAEGLAMNALLMNTTQHVFPVGLFELLVETAKTDDLALQKLADSAKSSDGVAGELLHGAIDELRNNNADRFISVIGEDWDQ